MLTSFYEGKSVLLTGSTGFLGKVILEKILRSFSNVKKIYLTIRASGPTEQARKDNAYDRYKNEIKDSQIFDALKIQLGMKNVRKLLRKKICLVPMDLSRDDLGLSKQMKEELVQNLNIIINSAGCVEFDTRLDIQVDTNVRGPLKLIGLARECQNFECFTQVSTCFALCDKIGFIDEKMQESPHVWEKEYQDLLQMTHKQIIEN